MLFKHTILLLLSLSMWAFSYLHADDPYAPIDVYSKVSDLYNPTLDDYRLIQHYLRHGERSIITRLKDYQPNARNLKIIGDIPDEYPEWGIIAVNCDENDRENCLVMYSSFNKNYPRGLKRLVKIVSETDFKGHIIYRLGGWPNVEGGSLVLAHVPYAFKVSALKEAQRLGFKRALWLDTAIVPIVSLNEIFSMIQNKGYFIMGNSHMIGPYMHPDVANAFAVPYDETFYIPSCSAGITGIDFTNEKGVEILDRWYQAAHNAVAFFSPRSDQNALSIILYRMGISCDLINIEKLAHNRNEIRPDSLLLIERGYVNELSLRKGG